MHFFVIYHKIVFFNSVIVRLYDVEKYDSTSLQVA